LFVPYEECLKKIESIIDFLREKEYIKPNTWEFDYYMNHKYRFAVSLSHIPKSSDDEIVCEVGSFTIFSILLDEVLGYKNIYGIDRINQPGDIVTYTKNILGKEYKQKLINVDLNLNHSPEIELPKFSKIFCFEVIEHLWHPMRVLKFFKTILQINGELYLSAPNCASALTLHKLLTMQVPMTYNCCNDTIQDAHFREFTPLNLKYALAYAGFEELVFNTFYFFSQDWLVTSSVNTIYPFPGDIHTNHKLQGDVLFSISKSSKEFLSDYPSMFYDTGKFLKTYYSLFPEIDSWRYFFPDSNTICKEEGNGAVLSGNHRRLNPIKYVINKLLRRFSRAKFMKNKKRGDDNV
jgi:hypothetical protein